MLSFAALRLWSKRYDPASSIGTGSRVPMTGQPLGYQTGDVRA